MDEAKLNVVVDRIYEAAARPELWRPVLHELALASNALGAQMLYHRPEAAALHTASEGLDDVVQAFFAEGWNVRNPRELRAREIGVARFDVKTDADLFTPDELDSVSFQRDFLDRYGLRWFAFFSAIPFDEVSPVILTLERPAVRPPFSPREVALLRTIVPHVQRAGQLSLAVAAAAESGLLEGLDRMRRGGLLLDDLGRVTRVNATAERQFGTGLSVVGGRLKARSLPADRALQAPIASVTLAPPFRQHEALDAVAVPKTNGRPLVVQATPLVNSARDFFQQARALVVLQDLNDRPVPEAAVLQGVFGLTPAQAVLAQGVSRGLSPTDMADQLSVSISTMRSHLKEVFFKTGTHSQSELAVLLNRLMGPDLTGLAEGRPAAEVREPLRSAG